MIESITIKNFLSIKDEQQLSFVASNREKDKDNVFSPFGYKYVADNKKLLKLLILVGENGSGKTNVLQAIKYIKDIALSQIADKSEKIGYLPFLFDSYSKNCPTEMSITYYVGDECYKYSFKADADIIHEEELKLIVGRRGYRVYFRHFDSNTNLTNINFGPACDLDKDAQKLLLDATINNRSVLSSFLRRNIESKTLRKNIKFFEDHLSKVHAANESVADRLFYYEDSGKNQMRSLIKQLMKDIKSNIVDYKVTESVVDILKDVPADTPDVVKEMLLNRYPGGVLKNRTLTFLHHTDNGDFELSDGLESDGTIEILRLMIVIYDIILGKKCSFVDEVEGGIHTKALNFILQMFLILSEESQLVIASQDLMLTDMEYLRRDAVRWIKKNRRGESVIDKINQSEVHKNKSLRNYLYDEMLSEMNEKMESYSTFKIYKCILDK